MRTWRAAGLRPNDTLDRPSVVWHAGQISALMRRMRLHGLDARRGGRSSSPVDEREASSGVEDQVGGLEAVAVDGEVVRCAWATAQLPLGVAGLALLVDAAGR